MNTVYGAGFKFVFRSWSQASTWRRDNFWRRAMAPILSKPMRWNVFLPMSMPIVANGFKAGGLAWHGMFLVLAAPCHLRRWAGQEHGGSIPLTAD